MNRAEIMARVEEARYRAGMDELNRILSEMGITPGMEKDKAMDRSSRAMKKVSNYEIAVYWFSGYSENETAKKVGMSKNGVIGRLKQMDIYKLRNIDN